MNLVILPFRDWKNCEREGFRTRDVHLILEFSQMSDVEKILVIDRPISLPEILLSPFHWKVKQGNVVYKKYTSFITQVSPKIFVLDIVLWDLIGPIVLKRRWLADIFSRPTLHKKIRDAIHYLGMNDYGLFTFSPITFGLIDQIGETYLVFFAVDDWSLHPQMREAAKEIQIGYDKLKNASEIIITTSKSLQDKLGIGRSDVYFIPNGVDPDYFKNRSREELLDIHRIKTPIVGYAGKIQDRLDIELVSYLVENLPEVSFVFLGPLINPQHFSSLRNYSNVYYLGDKNYSVLPQYIAMFDVCMIPHVVSNFTKSMNPLKFYEYLAAGKRVVTTPIAGIEHIDGWVGVATNKEEFLSILKCFLEVQPGNLFQIPVEWTWKYKAKQILSIIQDFI